MEYVDMNELRERLYESVDNSVWDSMDISVDSSVWRSVRDSVWKSVDISVESSIYNKIKV